MNKIEADTEKIVEMLDEVYCGIDEIRDYSSESAGCVEKMRAEVQNQIEEISDILTEVQNQIAEIGRKKIEGKVKNENRYK